MRLLRGFWTCSCQILERRRKKSRKIGQFGERIGLLASPWRWQILPVLRKSQSARLAQSLKRTAVLSEVWGDWIVWSNHFYSPKFKLWRDSAVWNGQFFKQCCSPTREGFIQPEDGSMMAPVEHGWISSWLLPIRCCGGHFVPPPSPSHLGIIRMGRQQD